MGRDRLVSALRTTIADRRGVMLIGPPGIGKTTVVGRVVRGRRAVIGQCLASLRTIANQPLSHAIGTPLRGTPNEVAAEVSAALDDRMLVIEDLHWADQPTIEVVRLLVGRVPMLVTSREMPVDLAHLTTFEVPPLDRRAARVLAERVHPTLRADDIDRLLGVAAGNPLLICQLVAYRDVSPTLLQAVQQRLSGADADAMDVFARLALFGRRAPTSVVGWRRDLRRLELTVDDDHEVEFVHDLIAEAVLAQLDDDERRQLHSEIAARCDGIDAARHHLAAGDHAIAASCALDATPSAEPSLRAELLALAVEALGDAADDRLRLDAGNALIADHRVELADSIVAEVDSDQPDIVAEAALCRSQAAWLQGRVGDASAWVDKGLAAVGGSARAIEVRLIVERAAQLVRVRVGDPAVVEVAKEAQLRAESACVDRAKARNALGMALAHTAQTGWEEQYLEAAQLAREEGDLEQECASMYWAVSAYGLYGPMQTAIRIDDEMLARTESVGLRRWHHHFLGAACVHRLATGNGGLDLIGRARRLLREDPLFRNRAQVELALATGLIDLGDVAAAREVIATGRDAARGDEDRSLLAVAAAELAFVLGDADAVRAQLDVIASCTRGFFGMNAAAESAALYCALRTGASLDVPRMRSVLMPSLDVVGLEHDAFDAWSIGEPERAIAGFRAAAEEWSDRGFTRFAARAWWAAAEIARRGGAASRADRYLARAEDICASTSLAPIADLANVTRRALELDTSGATVTAREREILVLVGLGYTTSRIARQLGISTSTVESHVKAARLKLGATTRRQASALIAESTQ